MIGVELLSYDASDAAVVNSARVSFAGHGDDWHQVPEDYDRDPAKLIGYLARHNHNTPFRHNSFTLRCKAPIFIARQLGKHQAGLSWNEVSRRYVDKDFEFHVPEQWRSRPEGGIKQGSGKVSVEYIGNMQPIDSAYDSLVNHAITLYDQMIEAGVAPEQARMVLPQSMVVEWVWTGNLLALAHIYKERIASGAQVEVQWFAEALDKVVRPVMPLAWSALVDKE